jgi:copper homeostasis protein
MLLEVIVSTWADAIAAEAGGATRLEIISHYEVGGLTPPFELVREIVARVKIPARVMLRETESFFVMDAKERARLGDLARSFADLPVEGLVLGFLLHDQHGLQIDNELLAGVLANAPHLKATFHRAFEELPNAEQAIADLKRHPQIDGILTSGGAEAWNAKLARFVKWEHAAQPEIGMLIGGGTDAEAIKLFCQQTPLRHFHVGRAVREDQRLDGRVLAERVRELRGLIV